MEREVEFLEDNLMDQIDWSQVFDGYPDSANALDSRPASSSWIDEIEKALMKDDDDQNAPSEPASDFCDNFLADILLDSPAAASADSAISGKDNLEVDDVADDPISKKRRRQLRNRDAAVRSRERKKMYVKDLEMKSKYLEGECRRLGRLLHCCYADNQALRFTLENHAAFISTKKQESAVLFLESLLLGSLLWWVSIMCLRQEEEEEEEERNMAPPPPLEASGHVPFIKPRRRRCKASWPKIKINHLLLAPVF